jgi:hypothetical protein
MNISLIDQCTATIKAINVQYQNGYHISDSDYLQFLDAVIYINDLQKHIKAQRDREGR